MAVFTVRGKLGSGAPETGELIARKLNIDYLDRRIIAEIAARLNRREPDVQAMEMPPASMGGRIARALEHSFAIGAGFEGAYLPMWELPLDDNRYLEALQSLIREMAGGQSLVIYGRGSQFILRDHPQAFHISFTAPFAVRLKRVMEFMKIDEESARQEINRFDSSGREFIRRYFRVDSEDPLHYDMVINTGRLTFEAAADTIIAAAGFNQTHPWSAKV